MLIDPPVVPTLTIWRVRACAPTVSCVSLAVCARRCASPSSDALLRIAQLDPSESDSEARPYAPVERGRTDGQGRRLRSLTPRVQVESEDWIGAGEAVTLRQAVHLRHAVLNQYLEATLDGAVRTLPRAKACSHLGLPT